MGYKNKYRISRRIRGIIIPESRCPLCGAELVVYPSEIGNADALSDKITEEDQHELERMFGESYMYLIVEVVCTNPDCEFDRIYCYVMPVVTRAGEYDVRVLWFG